MSSVYASLGKKKEEVVATDITSCVLLRLVAATRAVTRWHMGDSFHFYDVSLVSQSYVDLKITPPSGECPIVGD